MKDPLQAQSKVRTIVILSVAALIAVGVLLSYKNMRLIRATQIQQVNPQLLSDSGLQTEQVAPDFKLQAFPSGTITLKQYRDKKNVILAFYPHDNSPGCTKEMCCFSDDLSKFKSAGTEVLGISCDSMESHQRFSNSLNLGQLLLVDANGTVARKYGVLRQGKLQARRVLFVINKKGIIRYVYKGIPDDDQLIVLVQKLNRDESLFSHHPDQQN